MMLNNPVLANLEGKKQFPVLIDLEGFAIIKANSFEGLKNQVCMLDQSLNPHVNFIKELAFSSLKEQLSFWIDGCLGREELAIKVRRVRKFHNLSELIRKKL